MSRQQDLKTVSSNIRLCIWLTLFQLIMMWGCTFIVIHTSTCLANYDNIMAKIKEEEALEPTIFVVSLQGVPGVHKSNDGRLDKFKEKWATVCGQESRNDIQHCPGVYDPRRGYGATTSFLFCVEKAKEMDLNVSVFFEDDARLFIRAKSFCHSEGRKKLWANLPHDTLLAFLGGHSWVYPDRDKNYSTPPGGMFKESVLSFGAYGYAVPRPSMDFLMKSMKEGITRGYTDEQGVYHRDFLSPERSWYHLARSINKKIYAVDPLVVWHEGGFSNTWGKLRDDITGEEDAAESKGPRGLH